MPTWLIPTLKWGGPILVIVAVMDILNLVLVPSGAGPGADATSSGASMLPHWILLAAGVAATVAGRRLHQPDAAADSRLPVRES